METKELDYVQPHRPYGEEIYVEGCNLQKIRNRLRRKTDSFYPLEIFTGALHECEGKGNIVALDVDDFALRPDYVSIRKFIIPFTYDLNVGKVMTKTIKFVNKGTVILRFQLQQVNVTRIFNEVIPETKPLLNFYFNKNEELILPGQTIEFPIWFKTKQHGKHSETWRLITKPPVLSEDSRFFIVLQAYSEFGNIFRRAGMIDELLNARVKKRLENRNAEENETEREDMEQMQDPFLPKARVFEAINSEFNPVDRKPKYLYNHDAVLQLEEFYHKIKHPEDSEVWDLRIDLLQKMAKEKEIEEYYDKHEGKKQLELKVPKVNPPETKTKSVGKKGSSAKKPEGSKHSQKSHSSLVEHLKTKTLTMELEEILFKCTQPFARPNPKQKKYQLAYKILCVHVDKMCESIELMKINLNIADSDETYPVIISQKPKCPAERLMENVADDYENYETIYDRTDIIAESAEPTECLKDIPKENVDERFKTYRQTVLGIMPEDAEEKQGKKKGKKGKGKDKGKGDKKKKSKSPDKKGKTKEKGKGKAKVEVKEPKKEDFSCPPFDRRTPLNLEEVVVNVITFDDKELKDVEQEKLDSMSSHYKYNLYVIIYSELQNAVMEIADMVDSLSKQSLTHKMIKKLDDSNRLGGIRDVSDIKRAMEEGRLQKIVTERDNTMNKVVIQREPSETSIWSILDAYRDEPKPKVEVTRPISYPVYGYDEAIKDSTAINVQTETEGGIVSENWQKGWPIGVQKDPPEGDPEIDLEEYVELFGWKTSVQDLLEKDAQDIEEEEEIDEKMLEENLYVG